MHLGYFIFFFFFLINCHVERSLYVCFGVLSFASVHYHKINFIPIKVTMVTNKETHLSRPEEPPTQRVILLIQLASKQYHLFFMGCIPEKIFQLLLCLCRDKQNETKKLSAVRISIIKCIIIYVDAEKM